MSSFTENLKDLSEASKKNETRFKVLPQIKEAFGNEWDDFVRALFLKRGGRFVYTERVMEEAAIRSLKSRIVTRSAVGTWRRGDAKDFFADDLERLGIRR